jgi:hypothetical protein
MVLEYEHEPRDVEAWWLHYTQRGGFHRINYWASVALIAWGCGWVGTQIGTTPTSRVILAACGALVGWGLAAAVQRVWIHATVASGAKGHAGQQQFGAHRLSLQSEGILEEGPSASHKHGWDAVEGLLETADHFFLPVGGGQAYVIPKRALSVETAAAFKASVAAHLAEEERRRTRSSS